MDAPDPVLELARAGFPVFPLRINSKHEWSSDAGKPKHFRPGWTRADATTDAAVIAAWAEAELRCNWGYIVTPGRVVADADTRRDDLERLPADTPRTHTTRTATGGLHLRHKLPAGLALRGSIRAANGIELHGEGARLVAAGSTINGATYEVIDDAPEADAPAWIVEAIRAHNAQHTPRLLATTTPALQTTDHERARRWAEAALLAECRNIADAAKGERFHTLSRAAYCIGQVLHTLDEATARAQIDAATSHYTNPRKVAGIIASALKAGAAKPRHPAPLNEHERTTRTREVIAELVRLCDSVQWGGAMKFSTRRGSGSVKGATVRALLAVILQRAHSANTFDVSVSQRHLAEWAHTDKSTAWKALQAMRAADMLQLIEASTGIDTANKYRLTARGFLALQRVDLCTKQVTYSKWKEGVAGAQTSPGGDAGLVEPGAGFSPNLPAVDLTSAQTEIDAAQALGIFGHCALGRSAYVLARLLALHEMTPGELVQASGLKRRTVYAALERMVRHGLIERGGRGQPTQLARDFLDSAVREADRAGTAETARRRVERHALERKRYRDRIGGQSLRQAAAGLLEHGCGTGSDSIIEPAAYRERRRLPASAHEHYAAGGIVCEREGVGL